MSEFVTTKRSGMWTPAACLSNNKNPNQIMCRTVAGCMLMLLGLTAWAGQTNKIAIIPLPQHLEPRSGYFLWTPGTRIVADKASQETADYLTTLLRRSAGFKGDVTTRKSLINPKNSILLSISDAKVNLGAEAYELSVSPDAIVLRATDQAGMFYGVQTLLQLFPAQVYGRSSAGQAAWEIPAVYIKDSPRFKWRGLMLDVSRHYFDKEQIKRLLDLMALHKLNTFHWHLVDHDGWRIAVNKYPRLTEIGAWRSEIGYGLDPRTSRAFGPGGRYGGYYTREDVREILAYAKYRHINVVPEIELPGHSRAALEAYPELNCVGAGSGDINTNLGVYCAGSEQTFVFLENILKEVIDLFPSSYIHIGGDEVSKENWKKCSSCSQRMTAEGLKDEHELQSYFIKRIERFLNNHKRTLVGWSEIRQGGLAKNAVMMDWIGGGLESASEGNDVVMSPGNYCYFDHYQSLDYSTEPIAIACYTPLQQVYEFEPIPKGLALEKQHHILGAQANVWTEYIASQSYLDYMTFPRLSALSEVVWSARDSRNWPNFRSRLNLHLSRLDKFEVKYRDENTFKIGEWEISQTTPQAVVLEWDVTELLTRPDQRHVIIDDISRPITADLVTEPGKCHLMFDHVSGPKLRIAWAALLENGKEISRDSHIGIAGPDPRDLMARNVVYSLSLSSGKKGARYTIKAEVVAEAGGDLRGNVELNPTVRGNIR